MSLTARVLEDVPRKHAILLAYRHLYRTALRTIRYAKPGRLVLRGIVRSSFRSGSTDEFNPQRVINTLQFLRRASDSVGTEHKIIKNLIHVRYWQQPQVRMDTKLFNKTDRDHIQILKTAYKPFNMTLKMLNESLGLCLR